MLFTPWIFPHDLCSKYAHWLCISFTDFNHFTFFYGSLFYVGIFWESFQMRKLLGTAVFRSCTYFWLFLYTYLVHIFDLIYGVRRQMKKKIIHKSVRLPYFSCQFKILCIINFIKKYLMNFKGHFYIHFTPKVLSFIIFSPSELPYN